MLIETVLAAEQLASETSGGLIGVLGLDLKLFIAQLINFAVVLLVLWRWAFRPIVAKLNERTAKIEKGMKDAEAAALTRAEAEASREAKILQAEKKAGQILEKAQQQLQEEKQQALEETQARTDELLAKAKSEMQLEKERMVKDAKAEVAGVVVAATKQVLGATVTAKVDRKLVEKALSNLGKN